MGYLIGGNVTQTTTASVNATEGKAFGLGNRREDALGNEWVYVVASSSITAYDAVRIQSDWKLGQLTIDTAKEAVEVGFAQVAFAPGDYGWVMTKGRPLVRLAADADKELALYATAVGGVVDDATTSAMIQGLVCTTSVTGAVTAATCVAQFPTLARAVVLGAV